MHGTGHRLQATGVGELGACSCLVAAHERKRCLNDVDLLGCEDQRKLKFKISHLVGVDTASL